LTALHRSPAEAIFADYYRCETDVVQFESSPALASTSGYFTLNGRRLYGRPPFGVRPSRDLTAVLPEVSAAVERTDHGVRLPFDLAEVVTNLREERYSENGHRLLTRMASAPVAENLYYHLRPMLPVSVRRHLQQFRLRDWQRIEFPRWPVDTTVDDLMRDAMKLALQVSGMTEIPFIWFWPDGAPSCTMLTHDVEGASGLAFCERLMDIDARYGFHASFQLIPEGPNDVWPYAADIRARGGEVNLHDLNHDGRLYWDKAQFLDRSRRINEHARQHGCRGFRSGAMYRQQAWYQAFDFEFDMSVPNAAHLEPQRGGCCTVLPYFVGDILELPLTTVQDYSLFFILREYSIDLWREQIAAIRAQNGLISVISHPDYLIGDEERAVYEQLLAHLASLRDAGETWAAQPAEISQWWRKRRAMTLHQEGASWRIEGPDAARARVARASLDGERLVYTIDAGT
jgi:hypothetical protein